MKRQPKSKQLSLAQQEERLAYLLLLPTFMVIILIAIYPLGKVFYSSFTNQRFASGQSVEYVALDNYKRLLGMTIQELPPIIDDQTGSRSSIPKPISLSMPDRFRSCHGNRFAIESWLNSLGWASAT